MIEFSECDKDTHQKPNGVISRLHIGSGITDESKLEIAREIHPTCSDCKHYKEGGDETGRSWSLCNLPHINDSGTLPVDFYCAKWSKRDE